MKQDQKDIFVVTVDPKMTDDEIIEMTAAVFEKVSNSKIGAYLTTHGFDDDPRELYEIPEAQALHQRLVDFGFISILEVTTTVKDLATHPLAPGWGALEVWLNAHGKMSRNTKITPEMWQRFFSDLAICNGKVEKIMDNPPKRSGEICWLELRKKKSVSDGQHRHDPSRN